MSKKLAICILILFIPFIIYAEELSESESFLIAKAKYDEGSYSAAIDLFKNFLNNFPASPAIFEAKLYIAQCLFQNNRFIESRDILTNLEKSYVPLAIEDKFLFLSGQIYLRAKDFKEAAKYFKKLIEKYPDSSLSSNAKMQLGWAYFQDGRYEEASRVFDSLSKSEDLDIQEEALFKKGEALFFAKEYGRSLETYGSFIKIFPKSNMLARVYFYMGEANFYLDNFKGSIEFYSKSVEASEDDDSIKIASLQGLAWAYLKQEKYNQAEESFLKIEKLPNNEFNKENFLFGMATLYYQLSKFDKAVLYYDELINKYPYSELFLQAIFGKAQCLTNLSNFEEAIPLYNKIIEKDRKESGVGIEDLIDKAYYNLGYIYFTKKDLDSAVTYFQKIASLSEDKELKRSSLSYLADIYQELQKFDKAREIYSSILRDYSDSPYNDYVLYQLSMSELKTNNIDEAIASLKYFNKSFNSSELLDEVNYYLGYVYFIKNDFTNACEQLAKFITAFPESIYKDKAVYFLATSFYNRKMFDEAIKNFENILKEFKYDDNLREKAEYSIAHALYEQGKETEAIEKIRQFTNKYPKSNLTKQLTFWLGQYYYDNSLYGLARDNFQKFIDNYPNDKKLIEEAQCQIGLSYLSEGKLQEATEILNNLSKGANSQSLRIKAKLVMADLFSQQDKKEEAMEAYKDVLKSASQEMITKDNADVEFDNLLDYTDRQGRLPDSIIPSSPKETISVARVASIKLGDLYKEAKDFDSAIKYYRKAMDSAAAESNAQLQFIVAECIEAKGDLDTAIEEYLKIPYSREGDKFWVVRGLLSCANIYEDREDWQMAINMYGRILNYDTPEAKYAKERISSIKSQMSMRKKY